MKDDELQGLVRQYAWELKEDPENFEPIPKNELIPNEKYQGICRNAREARWDGKQFIYTRHKFFDTYDEEINHYEDDDGYDVFVPIKHK